jgi:hypothetical protein
MRQIAAHLPSRLTLLFLFCLVFLMSSARANSSTDGGGCDCSGGALIVAPIVAVNTALSVYDIGRGVQGKLAGPTLAVAELVLGGAQLPLWAHGVGSDESAFNVTMLLWSSALVLHGVASLALPREATVVQPTVVSDGRVRAPGLGFATRW